MNAEYYRRWRAEHAEYRERERERSRNRTRTPEQRKAERERAKARAEAKSAGAEKARAKRRRWEEKNREWRKAWHRKDYQRHREERIAKATRHQRDYRARMVMEQAAAVAQRHVKPDRRVLYLDPLYDEALMTAALAILEGADPDAAVHAVVRTEREHRARCADVPLELLAERPDAGRGSRGPAPTTRRVR